MLASSCLKILLYPYAYGRRAFCVAGPSAVGLEFPAGQLTKSGYWRKQLQTNSLKTFLFAT